MTTDVHQHFWTEPLVDALARRTHLPYVRDTDGLTVLHLAGEQPYVLDPVAASPSARTALLDRDHIDRALIALSSPVGIEALPREEAQGLIDAHLTGLEALPERFAAWGPLALDDPDPDDVDALLERGCVGVSLPATALEAPHALDAICPLLDRLRARGAPLFIHPGPDIEHPAAEAALDEPLWWPALTSYVSQMQAAWLTFVTAARREHPTLDVVFAMLAGCAPLQAERLAARGGPPVDLRDRHTFYDTSSYGPTSVEALARTVGARQLLLGSDRPVAEPQLTGRETVLARQAGELIGSARAIGAGA